MARLIALAALLAGAAQAQPQDTMAQRLVACSVCHGEQGRATPDGYFPRIAGKPAGYLLAQLRNFRDGRRHNAAMVWLMSPLSDEYLREIAEHFAALKLPYPAPPPTRSTPAQLARGEQLVREGDAARGVPACAACHGVRLTGRLPSMPGLAGLPPDYLIAQLGAWRTGARRAEAPDCMATVADKLGAEDVAAVARWIATLPTGGDMSPEPAAAAKLPLACSSER